MILRAILLGYLSLFLLGISDNIRGPLFPEVLKEFSLSHFQGSLFFAVSAGAAFVASFMTQFVVKKIGRLKTLRLAVFFMIVAQIIIGFSKSYPQILWGSIFFGLSLGLMGVIQNILVIVGSSGEKRQQLLAGLHSVYGFASFVGPLLISFLYMFTPSWRVGFLGCLVLSLLFFIGTFIGKQSVEESLLVPPSTGGQSLKPKQQEIFFAVILASYVTGEIMISTRLAVFSIEIYNYTFKEAAYLTGAFFLFLFAGRFLFTFFKPNLPIKTKLLSCLGLSLVLMLSGLYVNPLFFALVGLTMAPFYPLMMTAASRLFPHQMNSYASVAVSLSNLLVVVMHFSLGEIADLWGLKTALLIGPLVIALALGMLICYRWIFGNQSEQGLELKTASSSVVGV